MVNHDTKPVGEATGDNAAIQMTGSCKPDVIQMDLMMPEFDFFQKVLF